MIAVLHGVEPLNVAAKYVAAANNLVLWQVALEACKEAAGSLEEIHFVLFSNNMYRIWQEEASSTLKPVA